MVKIIKSIARDLAIIDLHLTLQLTGMLSRFSGLDSAARGNNY